MSKFLKQVEVKKDSNGRAERGNSMTQRVSNKEYRSIIGVGKAPITENRRLFTGHFDEACVCRSLLLLLPQNKEVGLFSVCASFNTE